MARGKLGVLFAHLSGRVGDVVIRRHKDGITVARRPKPSELPPSPARLARRERFSRAVAWASRFLRDPDTRAHYEALAKRKGKRTYDLMKSDFLKPPVVEQVDVSDYSGGRGDLIKIKARDNVMVTAVRVSLLLEDGETLEEGDATETYRGWTYKARRPAPAGSTVRIVATATDRPGGDHTLEVDVDL